MSDPQDGRIHKAVLRDGDVEVSVLSLGAVTQSWLVPLDGDRVPVILSYPRPEDYRHNPYYLGAIVGRVANRIGQAQFPLGGARVALCANDGPHHLHGGPFGLHRQNWQMTPDGDRMVTLRHRSPDGAGGYPGAVAFCIQISLSGYTLRYDMTAMPDRPTPISLAQHSYYHLGTPDIRQLEVEVSADQITLLDEEQIPTGLLSPVAGTVLDLRTPRRAAHAFDQNYVLRADAPFAARVAAPNGLQLLMCSDQPGLQLYTGHHLTGVHGAGHKPFSGLCLEAQGFPDSVNQPAFASIMATPDKPYRQLLEVTIAPMAVSNA